MKKKHNIYSLLRAFKYGYVDIDYTVNTILEIFKNSRDFNWVIYFLGMFVGAAIVLALR